jgi:uncharacterized protein GlcG (DUF336 family)
MAPLTTQKETLTLAGAKIAIAGAEEQARKMGLHMNIAVVDASTHLLHFSRMPNAKITSISIAIDKAFTAAGHRQGTHLYKDAVWPGGVAFGYVLFSHLCLVGLLLVGFELGVDGEIGWGIQMEADLRLLLVGYRL